MSVLDTGGPFGGKVPRYITSVKPEPPEVTNPYSDMLPPQTKTVKPEDPVEDIRRNNFFGLANEAKQKQDTQSVVDMVSGYSTPEKSSVPSTTFKLSPEEQEAEEKRISLLKPKYEPGETEIEVRYDDKHSNTWNSDVLIDFLHSDEETYVYFRFPWNSNDFTII